MADQVDIGSQVSRGLRLAQGQKPGPLPTSQAEWSDCLASCRVDEVPAGIALLDRDFVLLRQNRLYARYLTEYSPLGSQGSLGRCYFEYMPGSQRQLEGIFRAIRDQRGTRTLHNFELKVGPEPGERRTYWDAQLAPLTQGNRAGGILLFCQDRTQEMENQRELERQRARASRLAQREQRLESSLRVLDRLACEQTGPTPRDPAPLWLMLPLVGLLHRLETGEERERLTTVMESLISRISLPTASRLADPALRLTPREMEVAALVMAGKTSKEIAALLGVSKAAVDLHRHNLRGKLGLRKQSRTLRDHLLAD